MFSSVKGFGCLMNLFVTFLKNMLHLPIIVLILFPEPLDLFLNFLQIF